MFSRTRFPSLAAATVILVCGCITASNGLAAGNERESSGPPQTSLRFITTREKGPAGADAADYFGDDHGPTVFGRCIVEHEETVRRSRLDGLIEFLLPVKKATIVAVEEFRPARFWRELQASLAIDRSRSIVLFVHGYSYGFARGCRRVSGLQRVLGKEVDVILFSWPSDGNPLDYDDDRADLERSVPELAGVIRELADRFGAERIALAAHSMGAGGLVAALERLEADGVPAVSADLVLFAPDYDIDDFLDRQAMLARMAGRVTVYVSGNDRLLWLSEALNGAPRLGQGGEHLATGPGFDTIDVTPLRRYHPTGHEYHVFHPLVEEDLVELLQRGTAASERRHTVEAMHDGQRYWQLSEKPARAAD